MATSEVRPATVHTWSELATDRPMPLVERQRLIGEQVMISRVLLHKGFAVPTHHHENEQFACVLSGRVRFGIGADGAPDRREQVLTAGQVLKIPSNAPHSAEALEDSVVLDVFSPPSEGTGIDRDVPGRASR